jgi:hypothetical protein
MRPRLFGAKILVAEILAAKILAAKILGAMAGDTRGPAGLFRPRCSRYLQLLERGIQDRVHGYQFITV